MEKTNGDWVIVFKDKVVEQNKDITAILKTAESKYKDKDITISKNPSANYCFY